jgi:hypothetical protein
MGMFDSIKCEYHIKRYGLIDKNYIFQTKSLKNSLLLFLINEQGELLINDEPSWDLDTQQISKVNFKPYDFTGTVDLYGNVVKNITPLADITYDLFYKMIFANGKIIHSESEMNKRILTAKYFHEEYRKVLEEISYNLIKLKDIKINEEFYVFSLYDRDMQFKQCKLIAKHKNKCVVLTDDNLQIWNDNVSHGFIHYYEDVLKQIVQDHTNKVILINAKEKEIIKNCEEIIKNFKE